MKIAILGAGNVGQALGNKFAEIGHEIVYGVREPSKYNGQDLGARVCTFAESAESAEMLVLAVPFAAVEMTLKECGTLDDKIIVDATNPLTMTDKGLALTMGFDTSAGEKIAELTGSDKLVKCFNTTGFGNMTDPRGSVMFVCGNDAEANETVRELAEKIGFDAINIGDLSRSRLLEPLAMLWIHLAFTTDLGRDFAFSILRKS